MVANDKSPGQLSLPDEREIKFKSNRKDGGIAGADISVIEGSCALMPSDSVAMLTDGIVNNWKNNKSSPGAELSKVLSNASDDSAALQEALDKSVKECSKRSRKQETDDDLTMVIVKLNQITENDG
jgi:serine phosphatase RsbU (regulator of sigma subunit)